VTGLLGNTGGGVTGEKPRGGKRGWGTMVRGRYGNLGLKEKQEHGVLGQARKPRLALRGREVPVGEEVSNERIVEGEYENVAAGADVGGVWG